MLRSVQTSFLIQNIITYPIAFQTFHLKACLKIWESFPRFPVYPSCENIDKPDKYEYLFQHSAGSSSQLHVTG